MQVDEEHGDEDNNQHISNGGTTMPTVAKIGNTLPFRLVPVINAETGEPQLKPYQIFQLYAESESGLTYIGFCRLLDHLEIQLNSKPLALVRAQNTILNNLSLACD